MLDDTIAAIATPLGEGGISIIRLSGPEALTVADRCFRPPSSRSGQKPSRAPSHSVHYGTIQRNDRIIDEVLLTVMRAPRTFTKEDVVEISCHGGLLSARTVLDVILEQGARLAMPGEFTRRAFLNGRLDLTQAEAVADIIHARTELALSAAQQQLAGHLSRRINQIRDALMKVLAHLEAHIDFPDEDIAPDTREELVHRLQTATDRMGALLRTATEGRILRRGLRAVISGRPNVGKSSLLNLLLGQDRAIVSPVAGTTRDTIEETANIRGIPVVFIDTAGLRETGDEIEIEGVRRSRVSLRDAELVLHVLDASEPFTDADRRHLAELSGRPTILIRNKMDLPVRLELPPEARLAVADLSCVNETGIEDLKDRISALVWAGVVQADQAHVTINARHQHALRRAKDAADHTLVNLRAGSPLDIVAADLRIAVNAVGEVVGMTATEDLLDLIFSEFCIGK